MKKPVLAIIGRPNVGKSTLFNRIIRRREAIVDDQPGVTRDRNYADTDWNGVGFTLVDTGGYLPHSENLIHRAVLQQVLEAINEADLILFLVDAKTGLTTLDEEIAQMLRENSRQVLLVINKVDHEQRELGVNEFYRLALGEPIHISAVNGRNIGDMLDRIVESFPQKMERKTAKQDNVIKLAVVGKPNVGKSSLVNAILGKEKLIVTELPGTTRDAIDTEFIYFKQPYLIIDTAGLRKRSKVTDDIEFYSTVRSVNSIRRCHVAVVLIDARDGIQDQDKHIIDLALQYKKGIVLAVNKWDLIEKDSHSVKEFENAIQEKLPYLSYLPIIFISALTKQRIFKVVEIVKSIHNERNKKIKTSDLNEFLQAALAINPPPAPMGRHIKINYCTQIKSGPPVFAFYCNFPQLLKANYRQFLENKLRAQFGFFGVPLTLTFKRK